MIIDSKEENDFIVKTLFKGVGSSGGYSNNQKWIGAYENSNGVFVWLAPNGKKVSDTYDNWWAEESVPFKAGDPKYGRYAHMAPTHWESRALGTWTNGRSGGGTDNSLGKLGFICEWEKPKSK